MSKSRSSWLAAWVLAASTAIDVEPAMAGSAVQRQQQMFGAGWRMMVGEIEGAELADFDDTKWLAVTLPHAFNEDQAFKVASHHQKDGVVWYRKHFVLPENVGPAIGGNAFLVFEGVRQAADVYVNGIRVGGHENGISGFGVDATTQLKTAPFENLIAVRVDSSWTYKEHASGSQFQWNNKNFNANYGGINRAVRIHLTGNLHQTLPLYSSLGTTGVYIWADQFDTGHRVSNVHAESQVRNDSNRARAFSYRVSLHDVDGRSAGSFESADVTLAPGETRIVSAQAPIRDYISGVGAMATSTRSALRS